MSTPSISFVFQSGSSNTMITNMTYSGPVGQTAPAILPSTVLYINMTYGGSAVANLSAVDATAATQLRGLQNNAFEGCTNLTSFTFFDANTVTTIGFRAFLNSSLSAFTWPNSILGLGPGIFYGTKITNLTLPSTVTAIGGIQFYNCTQLKYFNWPTSTNYMDKTMFYNCSSLTQVNVGNNVTFIDDQAFGLCTSLSSIIIGNSVTNLGSQVYVGCSNVISITVGSGLSTIGDNFSACRKLVFLYFSRISAPLTILPTGSLNNTGINTMYPNYVTIIQMLQIGYTIGQFINAGIQLSEDFMNNVCRAYLNYTYNYLDPLTKTTVTSVSYTPTIAGQTNALLLYTVTAIAANAFSTSSVTGILTNVDFLQTPLISIGSNAFANCSMLTYFNLPAAVALSSGSFSNTTSINSTYPNYIPLIYLYLQGYTTGELTTAGFDSAAITAANNNNSFTYTYTDSNKTNITNVSYSTGSSQAIVLYTVTTIGANAFSTSSVSSVLTNLDLSKNLLLKGIGSDAFNNCTALTILNIPNSITSISQNAFYNCTSLSSITDISNVTNIGPGAFSRTALQGISLPTSLTLVDDSTFSYCSSLTNIQIPSNVTSIDTLAFDNCTGLTSVVLPYYLRSRANKTVLSSLSFSNTTAINNTNYSSLTAMIEYGGYTQANLLTAGFDAAAVSAAVTASCFNEGTKILCLKSNKEEYIPIQELRQGDIVKTYLHGYKKIDLIGKAHLRNNVSNKWKNNMFVMHKTPENNLIEDLIMTGGHSILVDELKEEDFKEEQIKYYVIQKNNPWKIDDKHLLLAGVSKLFEEINDDKIYTYYNFTLDSDGDDDKRYGIWANGILAEIPSKTEFISFNKYELL